MVAMVAIDGRTRIASSRRPTPRLSCENFFLRVSPEGWPWRPWWPSMIGHGSRRPAAQAEAREWCLRVRRRGICVSLAGFHTGRDRAARPGTPRRRPDVSLRHQGSTFRLVATMATMATPRGPTSKKRISCWVSVGGLSPLPPLPCFFFHEFQFRGGHGGHGGHDTRTAPETQRAAASARGRRVQALRWSHSAPYLLPP